MTRLPLPSLRAPLCALLTALPAVAHAWGPHPEITQAAVEAVGTDSGLSRVLGKEVQRLKEYCWMGDWRRSLRTEAAQWFYADDYLLFPATPVHRDHICPEVKRTYEPYFRRALQALRTESPLNAARWVGAILHFTEDTGSPPHAAEIRGDLHSKMENWVDAAAVRIAGYTPQLLGATEESAVQGFLHRMDGLIAFSKERAERARPLVLAGNRADTEPIVLESALETSRVVADLLFTLGHLAEKPPVEGGVLEGKIIGTAPRELQHLPAKVVLQDTLYSTLADSEGRYRFDHLPAGDYSLQVTQPGFARPLTHARVDSGRRTTKDITLQGETSAVANLVRNSALASLWLDPATPDHWYRIQSRTAGAHWEGEMLPLSAGKTYTVRVRWKPNASAQVVVRLRPSADFSQLPTELPAIEPGRGELSFPATAETRFAQVLIFTEGPPGAVCESVELGETQTPPGRE